MDYIWIICAPVYQPKRSMPQYALFTEWWYWWYDVKITLCADNCYYATLRKLGPFPSKYNPFTEWHLRIFEYIAYICVKWYMGVYVMITSINNVNKCEWYIYWCVMYCMYMYRVVRGCKDVSFYVHLRFSTFTEWWYGRVRMFTECHMLIYWCIDVLMYDDVWWKFLLTFWNFEVW